MATKSAAKAHRQSLKRRLRNRAVKSATKTAARHANEAIAGGDPEAAREAVRKAIRELDSAVTKGVLHPNNAARRKSRLILKYNAAIASIQAPGGEAEAPKKPARKTVPAKAKKSPAKRAAKKK